MTEHVYKPGDRVVRRRESFGSYEFGTVVGDGAERPGGGAVRPYLAVQWDGADEPDRYVWPDQIAQMPAPWQPKEPTMFLVASPDESAIGGWRSMTAGPILTSDDALDCARRNAVEKRGIATRIFAVVPIAEVTAPALVEPPVEVKEL